MNMAKLTKRSFIAITLILLAAGLFANGTSEVASSGNAGTEAIAVEAFTDAYVCGIADLSVSQGEESMVIIKGDTGFLDAVEVTNVDGYLSIIADGKDSLDLTVEIVTPDLAALMLCNGTEATMSAWDQESDLSIVLSDMSSLNTDGTLVAQNVSIYNQRALGGTMDIEADSVSVESNDGNIIMTGTVDNVSAYLSLDGALVMDNLTVQSVDAALYNDGSLEALLPGISTVEVATNQDSSATFDMNGVIKGSASGDSSISAIGDFAKSSVHKGTDASVSIS